MSVTTATLILALASGLAEPIEATVMRRDRDERERGDDHPFTNRHLPSLVVL